MTPGDVAMSSATRILTPEFIQIMNLHSAWPKIKRVEQWLRDEQGESIRNGVIARMTKGMPVDPRYVVGFASYLLMILKTSPDGRTATTFCEYIKRRSQKAIHAMSPETIAGHLLATETDPFLSGFTGMIDSFRGKICDTVSGRTFIKTYVRGCREEDIADATDWLYAWAASDLHPRRRFSSNDEAIAAAEVAIGLSRDEFKELAKEWRTYDEWSLVLAQGKYSPTGLSMVLPMRNDAYDAVREGRMDLREISATDLLRPSRNLIVVAIAQRPVSLGGDDGNTFKNVFAAHVSQVSILSACSGDIEAQPLRLLALVGTPQNGNRAETSGYNSLQTLTPDRHFRLYERVFGERLSIEDMLLLGFSRFLGQNAAQFLRPPHPMEDAAKEARHAVGTTANSLDLSGSLTT